jgi:undecaprenyl-diphosphatase
MHTMPDFLVVVILGIIEGITEFLPVSSTGHLLVAEHWLPRQSDLFNVVIQCGAELAVLPLFPRRLYQFVFELGEKETQNYLMKIFTAFAITCVGGYALEKHKFKLPEELAPVAWALLIGGLAFVAIEFLLRGKKSSSQITWLIAIAVGFAQLIAAVFPGTSRSGATILFCLLLGLARPAATEFSFLVGIPTMLAAGALKIFKAVHHADPLAPHENWGMILLATIVAAAVSFVAVKWLLRYVQTHTFTAFGWYRIVLAIAIFELLKF